VNVIKNPQFVFDINKSEAVDACLSVIATAFIESFSPSEYRLGKDSPSSKLLFAKDIPQYRSLVSEFYQGIHDLPPVSENSMMEEMLRMSKQHVTDFNIEAAVNEIYQYAKRFEPELREALDTDPSTKKLHLSKSFEEISEQSGTANIEI
jgi:hypothetical protein